VSVFKDFEIKEGAFGPQSNCSNEQGVRSNLGERDAEDAPLTQKLGGKPKLVAAIMRP